MDIQNHKIFEESLTPWEGMPSTRFQGSKKKLLPSLHSVFKNLDFRTCLDAFGGTGSVTFLLKQMGKNVTFNDIMPSNSIMARGLFSHESVQLDEEALENLFTRRNDVTYHSFIYDNYSGIYFTDDENYQIDTFCTNVALLNNPTLKSEAFYVLFQTLLSKRPYNLFHRANLHMRLKDVERSFGNKVTWDRPILEHSKKFLNEMEKCRSNISKEPVTFSSKSAFLINNKYDMVYIDTPYAKSKKTQESNYFNFYHFLDALLNYRNMPKRIHKELKHKPYYEMNKCWHPCENLDQAFINLFNNFSNNLLVVSYRSDGYPTSERLVEILNKTHSSVHQIDLADYKYALSTKKSATKEIIIIAKPHNAGEA